MKRFDKYGFNRVLEPKNSFLQTAWKLDNTMEINENELLVDVEILNINFVSFAQILEETNGEKKKIADRILEIVNSRGKLHNPITGTGGMLYGRVKEMGKAYTNKHGLQIGDEIISLVSLSTTPLKIERIIGIDIGFAQISIKGQAIMFESSLISQKPDDLPLKVLISAWDEAGAPAETTRIVEPEDKVIILGAWTKLGLLCGFAAREKMGKKGKIVGVINSEEGREKAEESDVFDEILCYDIRNTLDFYNRYFEENNLFDIVINCSEEAYAEITPLFLVKNKGTVFFASLRSDSNVAGLSAESIGKDITIIPYKGYVEGHAELTLQLLRKYDKLRELLQEGLDNRGVFLNNYKNSDKKSIEHFLDYTKKHNGINLVFESAAMRKVLQNALKVAKYECTVMIYGESGTGKEIIAQIIYNNSKRNNSPFVKINCASIPDHLLESELFGYEKGAFTGADPKGKKGIWEIAQKGILFLDEISELPILLQSKLLRVLQENEIYRIGGITPIKTDVRIIAATNKDLAKMVKCGDFREDLYYRLNVFPIFIPALSERYEDIGLLIKVFIDEYNHKFNISKTIEPMAVEHLKEYEWMGNIRELQNFIQGLLISTDNNIVKIEDVRALRSCFHSNQKELGLQQKEISIVEGESLTDAMQRIEKEVLIQYKRKYKTTRKMASALGMTQSSIARRLNKFGL